MKHAMTDYIRGTRVGGENLRRTEDTCAHCGASFMRTSQHTYKLSKHGDGYVCFCSYRCCRAASKKREREARNSEKKFGDYVGPMQIEEVRKYVKSGRKYKVWLDERDNPEWNGWYRMEQAAVLLSCREGYGKWWRFWKNPPTQDDRDAAGWEVD